MQHEACGACGARSGHHRPSCMPRDAAPVVTHRLQSSSPCSTCGGSSASIVLVRLLSFPASVYGLRPMCINATECSVAANTRCLRPLSPGCRSVGECRRVSEGCRRVSEECRSVGVSECRSSVGAVSESVGECRTRSDRRGLCTVSEVSENVGHT